MKRRPLSVLLVSATTAMLVLGASLCLLPGALADESSKTGSGGQSVWDVVYDAGYGNQDVFNDCAVDSKGNVIVAAAVQNSKTPVPDYDFAVIKYDAAGSKIWEFIYDYSGNEDYCTAVAIGGQDVIYATGFTDIGGTNVDMLTVGLDRDGGILDGWPRTFDLAGKDDVAQDIILNSHGEIMITGWATDAASLTKACLLKYLPGGALPAGWPKYYGPGTPGAGVGALSLDEDRAGNYVLAGVEEGAEDKGILYKVSPGGDVYPGWPKIYDSGRSADFDLWSSVKVDNNGNYVCGGLADANALDSSAGMLAWYTPDGTLINPPGVVFIEHGGLWEGLFGFPRLTVAQSNCVLFNSATIETGPQVRATIYKFRPDGTGVPGWPEVRTDTDWSAGTGIVVDPSGQIFACGFQFGPSVDCDGFLSRVADAHPWYLAEGSTARDSIGNFETWVLVQNPGPQRAIANMAFQTPAGEKAGPQLTLEPGTRQTINVAQYVDNEWSVSTRVTSDNPVVAERAVYWSPAGGPYRQAATDSIGANTTAKTWYMAQGSTGRDVSGYFETWVLVQNPGTTNATAKLYYQTPAGEVTGPELTLAPGTRQTMNVADTVANNWDVATEVTSDNPVVCECATYWNPAGWPVRQAAADSVGASESADLWYLAEGSTGSDSTGGFETWIFLQNPGAATAIASLYYQTPSGEVTGPAFTLAPGTRQTVNVANTVANNWSVSTRITSDNPIVCERAMYWNPAGGPIRQAATDSIGVGASSKLWYLAEGSTGSDPTGGFETWVLVQNPGTATAKAKLYYQTPTGEVAGPDISLAPGTRQTVNVAWAVANNWSVSTKVTSDNPVVCERAMYWNPAGGPYRQAATDSIGADP